MDWIEIVKLILQSLTLVSIIGGTFLAYNSLKLNRKQLEANHDWNRRQLAATETNKVLSEITVILNSIDPIIQYTERKISHPYSLEDIHKYFCKKDTNDHFIKSTDGRSLIIDEDKRYIRTGLVNILNKYDYLAGGILKQVFDETVVKNYTRGIIIKVFNVLKPYIIHLREFYNRPSLYEDLEYIANKWEKESSTATQLEKTA